MSDFMDELYKDDGLLILEIGEHTGAKSYSAPCYCVCLGSEIVVNTGSDIIHADNVRSFLQKKYPDKKFSISNEHISVIK